MEYISNKPLTQKKYKDNAIMIINVVATKKVIHHTVLRRVIKLMIIIF